MAEKKEGAPIQSGSMYLSWSGSRMNYVILRWAKAAGFMVFNGVVGTVFYQNFSYQSALVMFTLTFIASIAAYFNHMWRRLTKRTNSWIELYTKKLEDMERASGTESGVVMFSDPVYLSRPQDQTREKGTSKKAINQLASVLFWIWVLVGSSTFMAAIFIAGRGKW